MSKQDILEVVKEAYKYGSGRRGPTFSFCVTINEDPEISGILKFIEKFQNETPKYKDPETQCFIKSTCETIIKTQYPEEMWSSMFSKNKIQDCFPFKDSSAPWPTRGFFEIILKLNTHYKLDETIELGHQLQYMLDNDKHTIITDKWSIRANIDPEIIDYMEQTRRKNAIDKMKELKSESIIFH